MTIIAFDGACFGDGPTTGVGRAFATALAAYAKAYGDEVECVLLLPPGHRAEPIAGVRTAVAPRGPLRRQLGVPRMLKRLGAALLHSSVASVPLRATCPTIATAHDLPWMHRESGERVPARRLLAARKALASATVVLAPSTMTRDDVIRMLGRRAPRVELVPHGTPTPSPPLPTADERTGALLVLGDDRPRKNRHRLKQAHAAARARCPSLPELSFVGPPEHYVSEDDKEAQLRSCRALVHVSSFEGFGLPVLEGLAHAAPVLCSDLPPHREIAGDAARFVAAGDEQAIAEALIEIHTDPVLRQRLAAAGPPRAAEFSPERVAAAWRRVHTEVLA